MAESVQELSKARPTRVPLQLLHACLDVRSPAQVLQPKGPFARHYLKQHCASCSNSNVSAGVWELLDKARVGMGLQQQPPQEISMEQRLMMAAADREQRLDRIVGQPPEPPQPPQGRAADRNPSSSSAVLTCQRACKPLLSAFMRSITALPPCWTARRVCLLD